MRSSPQHPLPYFTLLVGMLFISIFLWEVSTHAAPSNGIVFYSDRATFDANAPGLPLEDWEEGTIATKGYTFCVPPIWAGSNDNCFQPGEVLPGIAYQDDPFGGKDHIGVGSPGFYGLPTTHIFTNYPKESTDLLFSPAVQAVGVDLTSSATFDTITISLFAADGSFITSTSINNGDPGTWTFWGVISSVPVGRINLAAISSEFVDNVAFGDIAIPPTETPIPPTETAVPPTETTIPPTETTVPPTETAIPPTETTVPPTETTIPPTETPPVSPTETAPLPTDTPTIATQTPNVPPTTLTATPPPTLPPFSIYLPLARRR